jgi:hypothetical protein
MSWHLVLSAPRCQPHSGVAQTRLKSSFIYLANAVTDLRGNWATLVLVITPLVLVAALCLLPDVLNLQHDLAVRFQRFEPGTRNVAWHLVQIPYAPAAAAPAKPLFPWWAVLLFHLVTAIMAFAVNLVVLCTARRIQAGVQRPRIINEAIEIYRESLGLVRAFFWILLLQILAIGVGFILLVIPGFLLIAWLYFAQYALVFRGKRGMSALIRSYELIRGRFLRVATRIVVFLAVWSGYNSWVGGTFFGVSLLLGPIGVFTGTLSTIVFLLDLLATGVGFATTAFFIVAGVRLYQDLEQIYEDRMAPAADTALTPTAPLPNVGT